MGVYSEILITIEELYVEKHDCANIAEKVNAEYGTSFTEKNVEEIIAEWAQDWYFARHGMLPVEEQQ